MNEEYIYSPITNLTPRLLWRIFYGQPIIPSLEALSLTRNIREEIKKKLENNLCYYACLREGINPYLRLFEDDMLDWWFCHKKMQVRDRPKFLIINKGE